MANTKLMKVMEYLINEQEDKARDLLHQIFIEKARAIHEEMMTDEDMDETMGGDMGDHLRDDISEIEAEEHYDEDTDMEDDGAEGAVEDLGDELEVSDDEGDEDHMDMDADMGDDADADDTDEEEVEVDMDSGEDHDDIKHELQDLEAAIEELKAEFEALKQGEAGEEEHMDADAEMAPEAPEAADEHEPEAVEEEWEADDEDYDDLDESLDLDTVSAPKSGEVGSGKFARADVSKTSPVAKDRPDFGRKAVNITKGTKHSGYDREAAPSSKDMGAGTGRRKDAEQYRTHVSKEGNASAKLNKDRSEGFGAPNTKSPISGR